LLTADARRIEPFVAICPEERRMRRAILVVTVLVLAACNNRGNWENQQAQLANELNVATATDETDVAAPAENDVNATATDANDMNSVGNNVAENEAAPQE
jgi:hypothetical protein